MDTIQPVQPRGVIQSRVPLPFENEIAPAIVDFGYQTEPPRPEEGRSYYRHNNINPPGILIPPITQIIEARQLDYLPEDGSSYNHHNDIPIRHTPAGVTVYSQSKDNLISPEDGSVSYSYAHYWEPAVLPAVADLISAEAPRPDSGSAYASKPATIAVIHPAVSDVAFSESPRPEDGRVQSFHSNQSVNKIVPAQNFRIEQLSSPLQQHNGRATYRTYTVQMPVIPPQIIKAQTEFVAVFPGDVKTGHGIALLPLPHGFVIASSEAPRQDHYPAYTAKPAYFTYQTALTVVASSEAPRQDYYPAYASKTPHLYETSFTPAQVAIVRSEEPRLDFGSAISSHGLPLNRGLPLSFIHVIKLLDNAYPDQGQVLYSNNILHANSITSSKVKVIKSEERLPEDGKVNQSHGIALGETQPYLKSVIASSEAPQIINLSAIYARGFWYSNPYPAPKNLEARMLDNAYPDQGRVLNALGLLHANQLTPSEVKVIKSEERLPEDGRTSYAHAIPTSSQQSLKPCVASSEPPQLPPVKALYSTGLLLSNNWIPTKLPIISSEMPRLDLGGVWVNTGLGAGNRISPSKITIASKFENIPPESGSVSQSHTIFIMALPGNITIPKSQIAPSVFGDGNVFNWIPTLAIARILPYSGTITVARTEEPPPYPGWACASIYFASAPNSYSSSLLITYAAMSFQCGVQAAMSISG